MAVCIDSLKLTCQLCWVCEEPRVQLSPSHVMLQLLIVVPSFGHFELSDHGRLRTGLAGKRPDTLRKCWQTVCLNLGPHFQSKLKRAQHEIQTPQQRLCSMVLQNIKKEMYRPT